MDDKEITNFDPTVAELNALVEATSSITAKDLENKEQLAIVTKNRIALKNARVKIEKKGKELREEATAYNKRVIAKEKELISIISPEEDRLAAIEEEAKKLALKKERQLALPDRRARLNGLYGTENTSSVMSDDDILEMDAVEFDSKYNEFAGAKLEADRVKFEQEQREKAEQADRERAEKQAEDDRAKAEEQKKVDEQNAKIKAEQDAKQAELDAKQKAIDDENARIAHEKEVREAEERARIQEREKAEAEAKRKEEQRIADEKKKAEDEANEKIRLAKMKQEEEYKRESDARFKKFLVSHGWTEETRNDYEVHNANGEHELWKKVGTLKF